MLSAGTPIHFATGQFAGQTVRLEVVEIQKANLGRRSTGNDRQFIDPPPVVRLRLFRVENAGTAQQTEAEINYDAVQVVGFLCTVDLFPVPAPGSQGALTEASKQTQALAGTIFVQPAVVDNHGRKSLLFTLGDLSVKNEGTFILRYRIFDVLSTPLVQQNPLGFIAEARSAPFRVYSNTDFPGFAPSTELTKASFLSVIKEGLVSHGPTKQLSRSGVKVKVREVEKMQQRT
ncbi:hypothetical protein NLJ89_g2448 [Agrocybe chaxingu]|uniref:Velvet domain-containing protein n=1 Tax=Agrocybe chaxingu TaxID=84603 RepID=A0A9W8MWG3_9AGAR|nr:hypothetical protein NLJ89_g2448 [Agrocybe chaxingu]